MKIIKTKNYSELSKKATELIISQINKKPNSVLCLPTGKTPLKTYKLLTKQKIDFSKTKFFNLDEYYPTNPKTKPSFSHYLSKNFFNHINAKKSNINLLNGNTKNPKQECQVYESKIKKFPIDLTILGVGTNGHIAFNEPGSEPDSKTRLVKLSKQTIKNNSKIFSKIPTRALTIGIKTILSSKKIILLASGKKKAKAINHLIKERLNKKFPVTLLKNHKNLTVILNKQTS